ncbi:MAG: hypothetical protein LBC11_02865, partial [Puniceicoccales bacterium]|nr:hypothetical protein [Puniceicoccales bacterium]
MDTLQESIANLRQQVNTSGSGKSAETTVTVNGRACTLKAEAKTFLWFKWTQITINTSLSDRTCEVAKFSYNRGKDLANKIEEIKTKLNTFEEGQKSSVDESEGPETAEEASLEAGEWDELNIDNKKVKDEAGSGTPVAKTATPQVSSEPPAKPASPEIARYIQQIVDCKTISYSISRNKSNDFQEVNALLDNIENFVQENRNNLSEEDMVNLKSALQGLLNKLLLNTGDRFGTRSIKETADSGDKDCSSIMTRVKSIETQLDAKLKEN